MFKMQQLRIIAAIAESGSMSAAAERVGLTQPALSKCVKEMERQLGVDLMVRSPRGVTLTAHGQSVARRAMTIGRELDKLSDDFSWLNGDLTGELSLGLTALGASEFLAGAIGAFRAKHPKVRLTINELRSDQIVNLVRSGALHCGIVTTYGESRPEGLEYHLIKQFEVAFVRGGAHSNNATLEELMELEWIECNQEGFELGYIATLARELGVGHPQKVTHCSSVWLSVMLAAEFGAICYFARESIPYFKQHIARGRMTVLQLDRAVPKMKLALVHAERDTLSPASREFTKLIRTTLA
jgi:DNA-binding transcriptional LysR family regulator